MKTAISFALVAFGDASKLRTSRKVPPRHPLNRLARLQAFGLKFADKFFPGKNENMKNTILGFTNQMNTSFLRDNCGFYDADIKPHGGPDPNPEMRENGKPRNPTSRRRRDDSSIFTDVCMCEKTAGDAESGCSDNLTNDEYEMYIDLVGNNDMCDEEDVDCAYIDDNCDVHGANLKRSGRKISDNPERAVKQITTGLRKWAERYLNNCHGMRKDEVPRKRARKLYNKWLSRVQEEIEYSS